MSPAPPTRPSCRHSTTPRSLRRRGPPGATPSGARTGLARQAYLRIPCGPRWTGFSRRARTDLFSSSPTFARERLRIAAFPGGEREGGAHAGGSLVARSGLRRRGSISGTRARSWEFTSCQLPTTVPPSTLCLKSPVCLTPAGLKVVDFDHPILTYTFPLSQGAGRVGRRPAVRVQRAGTDRRRRGCLAMQRHQGTGRSLERVKLEK